MHTTCYVLGGLSALNLILNEMKELFLAIELKKKYNKMELQDCVIEFEKYTNQKVPKEAVDKFKFCGLNNIDFFTSDWLNRYDLKNLLQFENGL